MNKVLFFSRDPGGANCIIPVVQSILEKGKDQVLLYGKDSACKRYELKNLAFVDLENELDGKINEKSIEDFIRKHQPSCIVTGTSEDDLTEKLLWQTARLMKIPSLAILDYWNSYTLRFSKALNTLDLSTPKINCLPDSICVMDDFAKEEMEKEGFSSQILKVAGQPYLALVQEKFLAYKSEAQAYRSKLGIPQEDYLIVFVSEAIRTMYQEAGEQHWGYDEFSLLRIIFQGLEGLILKMRGVKFHLVVRLHPKDKEDIFDSFLKNLKHESISVIKERGSSVEDLIHGANLVIGASSMLLLETALAGKPFLSLQCGQRQADPFILSRMQKVQRIMDREDLKQRLSDLFIHGHFDEVDFSYLKDAVGNIEKQIDILMERRQ